MKQWIKLLIFKLFYLLLLTRAYSSKHIEIIVPEDTPDIEPQQITTAFLQQGSVPESDPLYKCPVTSQLKFIINSRRQITLVSLDINGNEKTIGGDEYYITYHHYADEIGAHFDRPTAVATIFDLRNGHYGLRFKTTPMHGFSFENYEPKEGGMLRVVLNFSCGIGDLAPPTKNSWSTSGFLNRRYNVLLHEAPSIKEFEPPPVIKIRDPTKSHLVFIGDSMMMTFAWNKPGTLSKIVGTIDTNTVNSYLERVYEVLSSDEVMEKRKAGFQILVIIGSGVWDIMEDGRRGNFKQQDQLFTDHAKAVKTLITTLQNKYYHDPQTKNIQFIWKSMTYTPIHRLGKNPSQEGLERTRYASYARSHRIYEIQKNIMVEKGIKILDIFPASYLSVYQYSDVRHLHFNINTFMWNWFFEDIATVQADSAKDRGVYSSKAKVE